MDIKARIGKKLQSIFVIFLVAIFTAGCMSQYSENISMDSAGGAPEYDVALTEKLNYSYTSSARSVDYGNISGSEITRKIIRHATLEQKVTDLDEAIEQVMHITSDAQGYVQSSSMREYGDNERIANFTLRIPEGKYDEILMQLRMIGKNVRMDEIGQDVTEEYYDNEARIKNLKLQEEAVQKLFDKAERMEDILVIQKELFSLRADIEVLEGRNRYLDHLATLATVDLMLRAVKPVEYHNESGDSAFTRAKEGFLASIEKLTTFIVETFVFFVSSLPMLLITILIGGLLYWGLRIYLKRNARSKKPKQPDQEE